MEYLQNKQVTAIIFLKRANKKIKGERIMTLYEEFKEKYLRDDLIDFFIEKRKFI